VADDEGSGPEPIRAAGGVIWRRRADGGLEIVLVHRPAYDDWSLPKGKAEVAETDEQTALREVEEETGLVCLLGPEVATTRYHDRRDRPKVVRYWAMTPVSGEVDGRHEVDEAEWVPAEQARGRISYPRDRDVIDAAEQVLR
jgi:8-oxo-dGTP pyrophosphatase MutT (NUDIX family)